MPADIKAAADALAELKGSNIEATADLILEWAFRDPAVPQPQSAIDKFAAAIGYEDPIRKAK